MIDEGYHPMTMYFPLVVHGAMLIEPTESQAKEDLDLLHRRACARWPSAPRAAPRPRSSRPRRASAPRRRLDETLAARKPVLRWRPSNNPPEGPRVKQAAE